MNKRQKIFLSIGILIVLIIFLGLYLINKNQRELIKTQKEVFCFELVEQEKKEVEKYFDNNDRLLIRNGNYVYVEDTEQCIFEQSTTIISEGGSFMLYKLYELGSSKIINQTALSLDENNQKDAFENCIMYNNVRNVFFNENLNCSIFAGTTD